VKDVYAVIRQKEAEIELVRRQVQALLAIIPMLVDEIQSTEQVVNRKVPDPPVQHTILLGDRLPELGASATALPRPWSVKW
jgi:hypothetical protein